MVFRHIAPCMRLRLIVGGTLQAIGICFAVFFSNPIIALVLIYAGFLVLFHHKLLQLIKAGRNRTEQHISTHYIVQCKGEDGWFDLELQKYPRKDVLRFPVYQLAKKQLDAILKTRETVESDRLRIVKRTTSEGVV